MLIGGAVLVNCVNYAVYRIALRAYVQQPAHCSAFAAYVFAKHCVARLIG